MSLISLSTYVDMSGAATPSSGVLLGLDLDGTIKQKNTSGVVSSIAGGVSGSSGTSGKSGSSGTSGLAGSSGTSGAGGIDGSNALRWVYGDAANDKEFNLSITDFTNSSNTLRINITDITSSHPIDWLSALGTYVSTYSEKAHLKITDVSSPKNFGIYVVVSGVDSAPYWEYECVLISGSGAPTSGRLYSISWVTLGIDGSGGSSGSSGTSGSSGSSGTSGNSNTLRLGSISDPTYNLVPKSATNVPEYYGVDSTLNTVDIVLPDITTFDNGKIFYIKDEAGHAFDNNINMAPYSGDILENGSLSHFTLSNNYDKVALIKNSSGWWILYP